MRRSDRGLVAHADADHQRLAGLLGLTGEQGRVKHGGGTHGHGIFLNVKN